MEIGALSRDELIAIITAQQVQLEALAARVAVLEEVRRLHIGNGEVVALLEGVRVG